MLYLRLCCALLMVLIATEARSDVAKANASPISEILAADKSDEKAVASGPTLVAPSDGATGVTVPVTLQWQTDPSAASYRVQVDDNASFASPEVDVADLTTTSYQATALQTNVQYYWRVEAVPSQGGIQLPDWSVTWSFTTSPGTPSAPTLSSPANGATDVALPPTLSWQAVSEADTYDVQVATDAAFTSLVVDATGETATSYQASGLQKGQTYYWRARAVNTSGAGTWSAAWSFTSEVTIPEPPVLLTPADGSTGVSQTTTLTWSAIANADDYIVLIYIDTNTSVENVVRWGLALTNSYTVPAGVLSPETTFYWRVQARNSAGSSPWPDLWQFTTVDTPEGVPVLTAPSDGALDVLAPATLIWQSATGATSYDLHVATDARFTDLVVNVSGETGTSYQATGLQEGIMYYWRVRAVDGSGPGGWSALWRFTIQAGLPGTPTLSSPANTATDVALPPTLSWQVASGADTYDVQVATDAGFSSLVVDATGETGTSYQASGLQEGTTYYWRVRGENAAGDGPWSTAWSFTSELNPPATPTLLAPADNSTDVSQTATFSWSEIANAEKYLVQIFVPPAFVGETLVVNQFVFTNAYTPAAGVLSPETTFLWRVRAQNAEGNSTFTGMWQFTTVDTPSGIPVLSAPTNGDLNVEPDPTLSWQAAAGATSYEVQVATEAMFRPSYVVINASGVTGTSYPTTTLQEGVRYYWRVRGVDASGPGGWSALWTFIIQGELPDTPTLQTPSDNSTGVSQTPTLTWTAVSNADNYLLQVSNAPAFTSETLVVHQLVSTNTYDVPSGVLSAGATYYWRVRAQNDTGNSPMTSIWQFTTVDGVPEAPVLALPSDGAVDVSTTPPFEWNGAAGANTYHLQASTASDFSTLVIDESGLTSLLYSPTTPLVDGTVYYWRVRGENAAGPGAWSAAWSFTTEVEPPDSPLLAAPGDAALDIVQPVTLTWQTAGGADTYEVQVALNAGFGAPIVVDVQGVTDTTYVVNTLAEGATYYWHVRGAGAGGVGDWSAVWSFTTMASPGGAPALHSPADLATDVSRTPSFVWGSVTGVDKYRLQASTESDFSTVAIDEAELSDTTYTAAAPLSGNTIYYWRVQGVNAVGPGPWSMTWSFVTEVTPLGTPTLSSPAPGATVDIDPVLTWSTVAEATSYQVQIAPTSAFSNPTVDAQPSDTFYTANLPTQNQAYYWRVRARDGANTGPWSDVRSFDVVQGPWIRVTSPNGGEWLQTDTPYTITWDSYGVTGKIIIEIVAYNGQDDEITSILGVPNTGSYTWDEVEHIYGFPGPSEYRHNYRLRIFSKDNPTIDDYSDHYFGIGPTEVLSLTQPNTSSIWAPGSTQLVQWTYDPNAFPGYYMGIQIYRGLNTVHYENTPFLANTYGSYQWVVPETFEAGDDYYFRIFKQDAHGEVSDISGPFTIDADAPPELTISRPSASYGWQMGTWGQVWFNHSQGDPVDIHLHKGGSFLQTLAQDVTSNFSWVVPLTMTPDADYQVEVVDADDPTLSALSSTFTIEDIDPPMAPMLLSPSDGASVQLDDELQWQNGGSPSNAPDDYLVELWRTECDGTTTHVVYDYTTATTYPLEGHIEPGVGYSWRVTGRNRVGLGEPSETRSFIARTPFWYALAPAHGTTVSQTPTLVWEPYPYACQFWVHLYTSGGALLHTEVLTNTSLNSFTVPQGVLQPGTTYQWHVNAMRDTDGDGTLDLLNQTMGTTSVFTTDGELPPEPEPLPAPTLLTPTAGATNVSRTPLMTWEEETGADAYVLEVQMYLQGPGYVLVHQVYPTGSETNHQIFDRNRIYGGPLEANWLHRWRMATSSNGALVFGPWQTFTTGTHYDGQPDPPNKPTLVTPAQGAVDVPNPPVELTWTASPGATSYHVQVTPESDVNFAVPWIDQAGVTDTTFSAFGLYAGESYRWRVEAFNSGGGSGFTGARTFTTAPPTPEPVFSLNAYSIPFDTLTLGTLAEQSVRLKNLGSVGTLSGTYSLVDTSGAFVLLDYENDPDTTTTDTTFALQPGWESLVWVRFRPLAETDYTALIVFEHNGATTPDTLLLSGTGYVPPPVITDYKRYYYLTDHLGSVRTTVNDEGTVVHFDDYYPFGAQMPGELRSMQQEPPRERYTGHELDTETSGVNGDGLTGLYYAGARYYDPVIARWDAVDPMDDLYRSHSPYNYALNNPLSYTDSSGLCPEGVKSGETFTNENGERIYCLAAIDEVTVEAEREPSSQQAGAAVGVLTGTGAMSIGVGAGTVAGSLVGVMTVGVIVAEIYGPDLPPITYDNYHDALGTYSPGGFPGDVLPPNVIPYTPPPKTLPGFPRARRVRQKTGRARWKDANGDILEWDSQHGEIEKYNKRGKHKGSYDPNTGNQIKPRVPGRTTEN